MASVEILYRFSTTTGAIRPAPANGTAARQRLEKGNAAFAALFASRP
jgi:hypothetical protein